MLAAEIIYFYQRAVVFMPVHLLSTVFAASPETASSITRSSFHTYIKAKSKLFQAQCNSLFLLKQMK